MRFVARHVFKRVRSGLLVRKVAVFFQVGSNYDTASVNTALLELHAADIVTAVVTFTEEHNFPDTLLGWLSDECGSEFSDIAEYGRDKCRPASECRPEAPRPQELDMDLVFLVDSSQGVSTDVYRGALRLVDSVLQDLEVAAQPGTSWHGARGMNRYPPPELTEECGGPNRGDTLLQLDAPTKRLSKRQIGTSVFGYDSDALKSSDIFLEEKRKLKTTSVSQQEAVGNYEMHKSDTNENDQETVAKQRRLGSAYSETPNHGFLAL
ncbi:collagen alpha-4(VI) chain [Cricetulus griseus]|uniref:Collagen alpha-4(VI) chain n=1 Tax=Cricetulus griseus TaxID=10029 RepID=A0A061I8Y6_CRIGR|nr:collagen alpha-4(VI) chain [Cricetulus griseus]